MTARPHKTSHTHAGAAISFGKSPFANILHYGKIHTEDKPYMLIMPYMLIAINVCFTYRLPHF